MTPIQWMFHYKEILYHKEQEDREKQAILKSLFKTITAAGVLSHPKMDPQKVIDSLNSDGKTVEESAEEALAYIKDNSDVFPEQLSVVRDKKTNQIARKGKIDRARGIIIEE